MFIRKTAAEEIASSMENNLVNHGLDKRAEAITKIAKAEEYLNAAAEIFDEYGLHSEAEVVTVVLEVLAKKKSKKKSKKKPAKKTTKKTVKKTTTRKSTQDEATKGLTSDKMVGNLEEKGWVFNADDNHMHDENCANDCGMSSDMMYSDDDHEDKSPDSDLQEAIQYLTDQPDFEEDEEDLFKNLER